MKPTAIKPPPGLNATPSTDSDCTPRNTWWNVAQGAPLELELLPTDEEGEAEDDGNAEDGGDKDDAIDADEDATPPEDDDALMLNEEEDGTEEDPTSITDEEPPVLEGGALLEPPCEDTCADPLEGAALDGENDEAG